MAMASILTSFETADGEKYAVLTLTDAFNLRLGVKTFSRYKKIIGA